MADNIRTLAQLKTLLADNPTGNISEQDVRDFLVSVFNFINDGSGNVSLVGNVSITGAISVSGTVDGLDVSTLIGHKGAGGVSHALAVAGVSHGFMSLADKSRLDGMETGADVTANHAPQGHSHSTADITSGIFDISHIPNMSAGKITSDTFNIARIPTIPYTKINSSYKSGEFIIDGLTYVFQNGLLTSTYYAS